MSWLLFRFYIAIRPEGESAIRSDSGTLRSSGFADSRPGVRSASRTLASRARLKALRASFAWLEDGRSTGFSPAAPVGDCGAFPGVLLPGLLDGLTLRAVARHACRDSA